MPPQICGMCRHSSSWRLEDVMQVRKLEPNTLSSAHQAWMRPDDYLTLKEWEERQKWLPGERVSHLHLHQKASHGQTDQSCRLSRWDQASIQPRLSAPDVSVSLLLMDQEWSCSLLTSLVWQLCTRMFGSDRRCRAGRSSAADVQSSSLHGTVQTREERWGCSLFSQATDLMPLCYQLSATFNY